jgi:hypothetical protein
MLAEQSVDITPTVTRSASNTAQATWRMAQT